MIKIGARFTALFIVTIVFAAAFSVPAQAAKQSGGTRMAGVLTIRTQLPSGYAGSATVSGSFGSYTMGGEGELGTQIMVRAAGSQTVRVEAPAAIKLVSIKVANSELYDVDVEAGSVSLTVPNRSPSAKITFAFELAT